MADVADLAAAESELYLTVAINNARQAERQRTHTAGYCRWCGAPTPNNGAYCDTDCRDDHEKFARRHR